MITIITLHFYKIFSLEILGKCFEAEDSFQNKVAIYQILPVSKKPIEDERPEHRYGDTEKGECSLNVSSVSIKAPEEC